MSVKLQTQKMRRLAVLSQKNLGYIYDDTNGDGGRPAGEKKEWLNTGKAFLRTLAKDLGLSEFKVDANPGGIAVNGESTLIGMWPDGRGVYVHFCQVLGGVGPVLYRTVSHMKDYGGGHNQWINSWELSRSSYEDFVERIKNV